MIQNASSKAGLGVCRTIFSRHTVSKLSFRRKDVKATQYGLLKSLPPSTPFSFQRWFHVPNAYQIESPKESPSPLDFQDDTIYAISSGPGPSAIAIIRLSGNACLEIYERLSRGASPPAPRVATLRDLYLDSEHLDSAIVIYFPAPNSATGEDVLELHIHGGHATRKAILQAIPTCALPSRARYAEPGEFTRRAFLNDRLDLSQVEALGDTLSAETEWQRRTAMRGHSGKLGRTYEEWRIQLLEARGELEALIDFSEDQHFDESPSELLRGVSSKIDIMLKNIARHEAASYRAELLRKGLRIALLGPPNAGKSSLLNVLVKREASIVSHEAGTTRDIVEVSVDLDGYLCTFADTAGLRSAPAGDQALGAIEKEGIKRAKAKAGESDVVVAMAYITEDSFGKWAIEYDTEALDLAAKADASMLVINKTEKITQKELDALMTTFQKNTAHIFPNGALPPWASISCLEAQNSTEGQSGDDPGHINDLTAELISLCKQMTSIPPDEQSLLGVTERQRQLLHSCSGHLKLFREEAEREGEDCDIVVAAECLRAAGNCLARITGRGEAGDVEEVLGVVFEKFCVGK